MATRDEDTAGRPDAAAPEHQVAFGRALLAARTAGGMTQAEVARGAGMDRSFYVGVETGKRNVSLDKIVGLARALNVRPASLLESVGRPKDDAGGRNAARTEQR